MKRKDLNIMGSVRIIEGLKAQLIKLIGDLYVLLTRGSNVAEESIIDCLSGAIITLYVLADKLGYSLSRIDNKIKEKLDIGIRTEDEIEKEGKSLSKLKRYISNRMDQ
ncbi:MazG-like family protein [uncultured Clostridium sp.]|uniref:MazG-like family protein n=1 Tax=uncultured Clostridium sp. TaxID=59620 RepID=UPI00262063EA|nr:MazG-like family protein [uncultured Clostridium sp.]